MTFMTVLFVRIIVSVMSCCKKPILKGNARHVIPLVGVALICDTGTVFWMFSTLFPSLTTLSWISGICYV